MTKSESDEDDDKCTCYELIPLGICLAILLGVVIYTLVDLESAIHVYLDMINYIREHPWPAILIIIAVYIFLIIFCFPTFQMHLIVSYAYCKVFDSFWSGFAVSTAVISVAVLVGALAAILLSRYLFANLLKRKIAKSKNKYARSFQAIDEEFITNGVCFVSLIRLLCLNFGVVSYVLGVTSVSLCGYLLGTISSIVYIVLFALIGCSIWEATDDTAEGAQP